MRICLMCRQRNMEDYGICPSCMALNETMRAKTCDLTGKTAVVTGGRIKIGYATALRMLRQGASVMAVTRYPRSALAAYAAEPDYESFRDRLHICGFDLMRVDRIGELISHIDTVFGGRLDILINNAAQTVKKSNDYYAQLRMEEEALPLPCASDRVAVFSKPQESTLPILSEALPVDYSEQPNMNSWVRKPEEITAQELLEVQLINVTAPFLLTNGLRRNLAYDRNINTFVINVSSVEGRFNTKQKLARHVHTNMAKASLNMMTHSIASDYARDRIFVYACDPGWVSNQFPPAYEISQQFRPYLTYEDGAARVLYPVLLHLHDEKIKDHGQFYKDYHILEY